MESITARECISATDRAYDRARRGADYLDDVDPSWVGGVNPHTLDLGHEYQCVLGQLYKSYGTGLDALGLVCNSSSPVILGFADEGNQYGDDDEYIVALTAAWRHEIAARQA